MNQYEPAMLCREGTGLCVGRIGSGRSTKCRRNIVSAQPGPRATASIDQPMELTFRQFASRLSLMTVGARFFRKPICNSDHALERDDVSSIVIPICLFI